MVQELILCGFKVQVPLTPSDEIQVEKISRGLGVIVDLKKESPPLSPQERDLYDGLKALHSLALCLLDASRAAAGPNFQIQKKKRSGDASIA